MAMLRQVVVIFLAFVLGAGAVRAASSAENRAFRAAKNAFDDHQWEFAEGKFATFAEKYPKSEYRAAAILFQGQAQVEQHKLAQAIALLEARAGDAGGLADQYLAAIG